jgi:hypothetical protein
MNWQRPLGGLALLVIAAGIVGAIVAATGATGENGLLGSEYQAAALVTGGVIVVGLTIIAAVGRPWSSDRTPYW